MENIKQMIAEREEKRMEQMVKDMNGKAEKTEAPATDTESKEPTPEEIKAEKKKQYHNEYNKRYYERHSKEICERQSAKRKAKRKAKEGDEDLITKEEFEAHMKKTLKKVFPSKSIPVLANPPFNGRELTAISLLGDQEAKADAGKPQLSLSLMPTVLEAVARVREYGIRKYKDPENWRKVEVKRYNDAFTRHYVKFLADPNSRDEESGLLHLDHALCNLFFIKELTAKEGK